MILIKTNEHFPCKNIGTPNKSDLPSEDLSTNCLPT